MGWQAILLDERACSAPAPETGAGSKRAAGGGERAMSFLFAPHPRPGGGWQAILPDERACSVPAPETGAGSVG